MTKKQIPISAVLLLCVLLTGCTTWYSLPEEVKLRGRLISNYPQWAVSCTSTGGVSDWKLWQDEQASSLRKLVPSDFAFDDGMSVYDYKGFYQLELGEQALYIQFDNGYECGLLYLFMEEPTKENYDNPLGPGVFMLMCSQYPSPVMTTQITRIVQAAPLEFLSNPFVKNYLQQARK